MSVFVYPYFNGLTTRAGLPPNTTLLPNDFVTTAPAATMTLSPKVTPGQIMAPPPTHTSSPKVTGLPIPIAPFRRSSGSAGWLTE